jgi:hypothetical protein
MRHVTDVLSRQTSFDPGTIAAFATFAIGLLARPFGGIVFGYFGTALPDRNSLLRSVLGLSSCRGDRRWSRADIGGIAPRAIRDDSTDRSLSRWTRSARSYLRRIDAAGRTRYFEMNQASVWLDLNCGRCGGAFSTPWTSAPCGELPLACFA